MCKSKVPPPTWQGGTCLGYPPSPWQGGTHLGYPPWQGGTRPGYPPTWSTPLPTWQGGACPGYPPAWQGAPAWVPPPPCLAGGHPPGVPPPVECRTSRELPEIIKSFRKYKEIHSIFLHFSFPVSLCCCRFPLILYLISPTIYCNMSGKDNYLLFNLIFVIDMY